MIGGSKSIMVVQAIGMTLGLPFKLEEIKTTGPEPRRV
jgi:hypothetical protein